MRVAIAPDSFSSTLSAVEAARSIAAGWRAARPGDDLIEIPMSDGGEGLLDAVEAAVPAAHRHTVEVANARAYAVEAQWLRLPDGTAVIESAQACGLSRLPEDQRNPRLTTTYGVGQLLLQAVAAGAARIVVGLGGSATVDGGAGMATALGHRLLRSDGNGVKVGSEYLSGLDRIAGQQPVRIAGAPWAPQSLTLPEVLAAVDVDAPLLGPDGAVAGFALQKGAPADDLPSYERNLRRLADVVERDVAGGPWRDLPGAGAAGGLGFGLAAFAGARLVRGANMVAELVGLHAAVETADVVITGEGRWDSWSVRGKVPGAVVGLGRAAGARILAVVGDDSGHAAAHCDDVVVLGPGGLQDPAASVAGAAKVLAARLE